MTNESVLTRKRIIRGTQLLKLLHIHTTGNMKQYFLTIVVISIQTHTHTRLRDPQYSGWAILKRLQGKDLKALNK